MIRLTRIASATTPPTGTGRLYHHTDGSLRFKRDDGSELILTNPSPSFTSAGDADATIPASARNVTWAPITADRVGTLPSASDIGAGNSIWFAKGDNSAFKITLVAALGNNINDASSYELDAPYQTVELISDGVNTLRVKHG